MLGASARYSGGAATPLVYMSSPINIILARGLRLVGISYDILLQYEGHDVVLTSRAVSTERWYPMLAD